MIKSFALTFLIIISTNLTQAQAHEHSETVCSSLRKDVCAHLGFEKPLAANVEAEFMAHVVTPGSQPISSFNLDLWMEMGGGHGHGSAPVEIHGGEKNLFKITNAWFVMMGQWMVRMDFDFEGAHHHIEIPVQIKN